MPRAADGCRAPRWSLGCSLCATPRAVRCGSGIERHEVIEVLTEFSSFDNGEKGYLEKDEAMRMLESKNETRTFYELEEMFIEVDVTNDGKIDFLEWACAVFHKTWEDLHREIEVEVERTQAISDAERALAETEEGKGNYERARAKSRFDKEEIERLERERLEEEAKLTGAKAAAAFFQNQIRASEKEATTTMSNADQIRHDYAKRKEAKELAEKEAKAAKEKAEAEAEAEGKAEAEKERQLLEQEVTYEAQKKAEEDRVEAEKKAAEDERKAKRAEFLKKRASMFENKD